MEQLKIDHYESVVLNDNQWNDLLKATIEIVMYELDSTPTEDLKIYVVIRGNYYAAYPSKGAIDGYYVNAYESFEGGSVDRVYYFASLDRAYHCAKEIESKYHSMIEKKITSEALKKLLN